MQRLAGIDITTVLLYLAGLLSMGRGANEGEQYTDKTR